MLVVGQTIGLLSHVTEKSNGLALLTNKIYVVGSLASFSVVTVISGDLPSPRTAVSQCLPQLTFSLKKIILLPGIEPATYLFLNFRPNHFYLLLVVCGFNPR